VVYAKPPFGGPAQVLAYLARYTHRAAIANTRLTTVDGDQVAFAYKDYRHRSRHKVMRLEPDEFIRRFLLHVLPDGFHRIRHYGFLANGHRAGKIERCRAAIAAQECENTTSIGQAPRSATQKTATSEIKPCPACGGVMRTIGDLPPARAAAFQCDTS
jgi:hypothetical protein